jgi:two-component system, chemotaxis family, protein-glutamate methylesterase/glutaminase
MDAFPPDIAPADGKQPTSLICPDCGGSITVRALNGIVAFECRVGHLYSLEDMIIGKEAHIEHVMWSAVHAYSEMAAFLRNIGDHNGSRSLVPDADRVRRLEQAEAHARRLREIVESDRRLTLPEPPHGETVEP